jgi:hypothetical protein
MLLLLAALCSCRAGDEKAAGKKETDKESSPSPRVTAPAKIKPTSPAFQEGVTPMAIQLTSTAFANGSAIPRKYTGEGEDVSPPLAWSGLPDGTRELALICDDPDAPRKDPWVHWVIYKIPADSKGLPEGVEATAKPQQPAGSVQGKNSWPNGENVGYRGPMPPPGKPHRYFFKLYALDQGLDAKPELTKEELLAKISGHVLGQGQLLGTYQR